MKFKNGKGLEFYSALSKRIDQYFSEKKISKTGNFEMRLKCGVLIVSFVSLYFIMLLVHASPFVFLALVILFGINSALIFFNLVHDASHNVLFQNRRINGLIKYMGDIVGVNSYIWHIRHDIQHHSFTKVLGGDLIIENLPILRLSPHQKLRPIHRFQFYYAPLLYSMYSLYWIFFLDFRFFCKKEICNIKVVNHPSIEWTKMVVFKAFYIIYMLVIPILVLPYSWTFILMTFIIMHILIGLIISLVSVLGHEVNGVNFPSVDINQTIDNSWSEHELETTADFANSSIFLTWLIGGLNNHICHHLFPDICHIHYKKLTPIIKKYCAEHGYKFTDYSLLYSLKAHAKYLRTLSRNN